MRLPPLRFAGVVLFGIMLAGSRGLAREVMLHVDPVTEPAKFAADEIETALKARGDAVRRGALKDGAHWRMEWTEDDF